MPTKPEERQQYAEVIGADGLALLEAVYAAEAPAGLRELEADDSLGGENDVLIAGKCSASGTGTAASQRSDRCAFATAGQAADNSSKSGASTGHDRCALAFTFGGESPRSSLNWYVSAVQCDGFEANLQFSPSLEPSQGFRVGHGAGHVCTARNHDLVPRHNILRYRSVEGLTGLAELRANRGAQADGDGGAGGHNLPLSFPGFLALCAAAVSGASVGIAGLAGAVCVVVVRGRLAGAAEHSQREIETQGKKDQT